MNRFRQCIYTLILLLTCFVASPFIYKQIWNNSKVKASKTTIKTPVAATQPAQTTPSDPNAETQPTSEGETAPANAEHNTIESITLNGSTVTPDANRNFLICQQNVFNMPILIFT